MYRRKTNRVHPLIVLARIILALVFIFSGFVKAVDPWGTAIKLGEYFSAFGMEWLDPAKYVLSVALSSFELVLGLLLLFGIRMKATSFLTMFFMSVMTVVTLIIAVTNPVNDCGCFGDAVKLTNWETFFKNIVLLTLSVAVFIYFIKLLPSKAPAGPDIAMLCAFVAIAAFIGVYSMLHLPLIDFLPYKTGVNIAKSMGVPEGESQGEYKTVLVYKNLQSGDTREFEVEDTTWYDSDTWEFVDSRSTVVKEGYVPPIGGFNVFDSSEDVTADILRDDSDVFLFTIDDIGALTHKKAQAIRQASDFAEANGYKAVCVTPSPLNEVGILRNNGIELPLYNIDATTLKTMIRAHEGLIILNAGTIIAKWNLRDIPSFRNAENTTATGYVISQYRKMRERNSVILFISAIVILIIIRKCIK